MKPFSNLSLALCFCIVATQAFSQGDLTYNDSLGQFAHIEYVYTAGVNDPGDQYADTSGQSFTLVSDAQVFAIDLIAVSAMDVEDHSGKIIIHLGSINGPLEFENQIMIGGLNQFFPQDVLAGISPEEVPVYWGQAYQQVIGAPFDSFKTRYVLDHEFAAGTYYLVVALDHYMAPEMIYPPVLAMFGNCNDELFCSPDQLNPYAGGSFYRYSEEGPMLEPNSDMAFKILFQETETATMIPAVEKLSNLSLLRDEIVLAPTFGGGTLFVCDGSGKMLIEQTVRGGEHIKLPVSGAIIARLSSGSTTEVKRFAVIL